MEVIIFGSLCFLFLFLFFCVYRIIRCNSVYEYRKKMIKFCGHRKDIGSYDDLMKCFDKFNWFQLEIKPFSSFVTGAMFGRLESQVTGKYREEFLEWLKEQDERD